MGGASGLNEVRRRMETRGQVRALHGPPWPSNHSKLTENTIGELSVKSQLTTHHCHKAMAI